MKCHCQKGKSPVSAECISKMCFSQNAAQKLKNASLSARVAGTEGREEI
jgi:hypothetical protein